MTNAPLISIGIPTYNRNHLLKQTLRSIFEQSFTNFEVIIGNDYTDSFLTADMIDVNDSRVRIINNPKNLGEAENMNSLLKEAKGRYFTWQFDDDLYSPRFLSEVYNVINKDSSIQCIYTSYGYIWGQEYPKIRDRRPGNILYCSGLDLLCDYFSNKVQVASSCGVYNTDILRKLGGVQQIVASPIAVHAEFKLLIDSSSLEKIAYIDSPLFFSRDYPGTFSGSNKDFNLYIDAGKNLLIESMRVIDSSITDNNKYFCVVSGVIKIIVEFYLMRQIASEGSFNKIRMDNYLIDIVYILNNSKVFSEKVESKLIIKSLMDDRWIGVRIKAFLKWNSPRVIVNLIKKLRANNA